MWFRMTGKVKPQSAVEPERANSIGQEKQCIFLVVELKRLFTMAIIRFQFFSSIFNHIATGFSVVHIKNNRVIKKNNIQATAVTRTKPDDRLGVGDHVGFENAVYCM